MEALAGKVQGFNGEFFAKDSDGNIVTLKNGDSIVEGMTVFGSKGNPQNAYINISMLDTGELLVISGVEEQLFDSSVDKDEVIMDAALAEESISGAEGVLAALQDSEKSAEDGLEDEETAAGEEDGQTTDGNEADFLARDGDSTDVNTDLRAAEFDAAANPPQETLIIPEEVDYVPVAGESFATVDDDGLYNGNPLSMDDDDDANDGDDPLDVSEASFTGTLNFTAIGDLPVTVDFSAMDGRTGTVGIETVSYSWDATTGVLTATVDGGYRDGLPLFEATITDASTGDYRVVLNDNVLHPSLDGDEVGDNTENNVVTALTFTVTDNNGSSDNGTLSINFDDDMPTIDVGLAGVGSVQGVVISQDEGVVVAQGDIVNEGYGTSVDQWSFTHNGGALNINMLSERNGLDIDGDLDTSNLDIMIRLFNSNNILMGVNDDYSTSPSTGGADGSTHSYDSYLDFGSLPAGEYTLSVGACWLDNVEALNDYNDSSRGGTYQITFTGDITNVYQSDRSLQTLTTQDAETIGADSDTATASFASAFTLTQDMGADDYNEYYQGDDGPRAMMYTPSNSLSYALSVTTADSGLTSEGEAILLSVNGAGVIEGRTSAPEAIFTVSVNSLTGEVTLTQNSEIDHLTESDTDSNGIMDDNAVSNLGLVAGNVVLTATASITDADGDTAIDSQPLDISSAISFDDDVPSVDVGLIDNGDFSLEPFALTTQDADTIDTDVAVSDTDSKDFSSLFTLTQNMGADDGGTPAVKSYSLSVTAGSEDSGLTSEGEAIMLSVNGAGVIEGRTSAAEAIFTVSVNSVTGEVTLTQNSEIDHLTESDTDSNGIMDDNAVSNLGLLSGNIILTASATITDDDGDQRTDSQPLDISSAISFDDDLPTVDVELVKAVMPELTTQDAETIDGETSYIVSDDGLSVQIVPGAIVSDTDSEDFSGLFRLTQDTGADDLEPGDSGVASLSYALSVTTAASGLTSEGLDVVLSVNAAGVIEGRTSGVPTVPGPSMIVDLSGRLIFTVEVDSAGNVKLTQMEEIDHLTESDTDSNGIMDDNAVSNLGLVAGNVILTANATIIDDDGDAVTDSESRDISSAISFDDDLPTVDVELVTKPESADLVDLPTLTTQDADTIDTVTPMPPFGDIVLPVSDTDNADFSGLFRLSQDAGADDLEPGDSGVASLSYALSVTTATSGLTSEGLAIVLNDSTGSIVGTTDDGQGNITVIFSVSVDAGTGEVTLTQMEEIDHTTETDTDSNGMTDDDVVTNLGLVAGNVILTANATIIDDDGDAVTDSESRDISSAISFDDDVPSVDVGLLYGGDFNLPTLTTQDADTIDTDSDTDDASFASLFTLTQNMGADDGGTPAVKSYSLSVTVGSEDSGLTSEGEAIMLSVNGAGVIEGRTSAAEAIFTVSVNSVTGEVTLTQNSEIDHTDETADGDATNNDVDNLGLLSGNVMLTAEATITDDDGDTRTDSQDLDISSAISFDDDLPTIDVRNIATDTIMVDESPIPTDGDGIVSAYADYADNFVATEYGADGAGSVGYALVLTGTDVGSGLYTLGVDGAQGNEIVLNVDGDDIVGTYGGTTYFTISVEETGVNAGRVTFEQSENVYHSVAGDNSSGEYDDAEILTILAGDGDVANSLVIEKTITDGDGDEVKADIDLSGKFSIQDDGPSAVDESQTLTFDPVTNVTFVVDVSSSMSDDDLSLTEDAISDLISQYDGMGTVNVNIIQTWGGSGSNGTGLDVSGWGDENIAVSLFTDKAGTDFDQGLEAAIAEHAIAPSADNSVIYFFGDGNTYGSYETSFDAFMPTWDAFIANENIELHTIGVNCSSLSDLDRIADAGSIGALYVDDINDLDDVLEGIVESSVSGNMLDNIDFGTDGEGEIASVTIGSTEYFESDFPITTPEGATLALNFDNGNYTYSASTDDIADDVTEVFTIKAVDADGDSTTFDVTINVDVDHVPDIEVSDNTVYEVGLTDVIDESEKTIGTFTITSLDGVASITVYGTVITEAQLIASSPVTPVGPIATEYGAITINGYDSGTGVVNYSYEISTNTLEHNTQGANVDGVIDNIVVRVTDDDGDFKEGTINISVVDDIPTILNPQDAILTNEIGNVLAGADLGIDFGADGANTNPIAAIMLTPEVDVYNHAVKSDGTTKLTSTVDDGTGTDTTVTYNLVYVQNGDGSVTAYQDTAGGAAVFTLTPDVATGTYSVSIVGQLDGQAYTTGNIFDSNNAVGGGNTDALLFELDGLHVLATGRNGSYIDADVDSVNHSNANGLAVSQAQKIEDEDILILNFTDDTVSLTDYDGDGVLFPNEGNNGLDPSWIPVIEDDARLSDPDASINNAIYLTAATFTLGQFGSDDTADWVAYKDGGIVASGSLDYNATLTDTFTITEAGGFNEVRFTAADASTEYTVLSMYASNGQDFPAVDHTINVGVMATDGDGDVIYESDALEVTFDGDGVIDYVADTVIDGGDGYDALVLTSSDLVLDFSDEVVADITDIEAIDMTAVESQTLNGLSLDDVVDMTSGIDNGVGGLLHSLEIVGNSGDQVNLDTSGWTLDSTVDGATTNTYEYTCDTTNNSIALTVDDDVVVI